MVNQWLTVSVILFGIIVAIIGVVAYLRMYKNSSWTFQQNQQRQPRPTVLPAEKPVDDADNPDRPENE
jgi:uncharacterized protein YpmB